MLVSLIACPNKGSKVTRFGALAYSYPQDESLNEGPETRDGDILKPCALHSWSVVVARKEERDILDGVRVRVRT